MPKLERLAAAITLLVACHTVKPPEKPEIAITKCATREEIVAVFNRAKESQKADPTQRLLFTGPVPELIGRLAGSEKYLSNPDCEETFITCMGNIEKKFHLCSSNNDDILWEQISCVDKYMQCNSIHNMQCNAIHNEEKSANSSAKTPSK